jgi:CRP-like cAMP-binding protein
VTVDVSQIAPELRGTYLFSALDDEGFRRVATSCHLHSLERGAHLFAQGDAADRFYRMQGGRVKLYRLSPDGQEKVIDLVGPGQFFAEAVMFMDHRRYPVHAQVLEPATVLSFDSNVYRAVLRHSADACFRLMAAMSMRLHAQLNEIENLTLHNATVRLVDYLLASQPAGGDETSAVHLALPKGVLAARLSIKPETFSRILAQLRQGGLIEVRGQDIVLKDISALRRLIET